MDLDPDLQVQGLRKRSNADGSVSRSISMDVTQSSVADNVLMLEAANKEKEQMSTPQKFQDPKMRRKVEGGELENDEYDGSAASFKEDRREQ
jgi:hypothetical protein